MFDDEIQDAGVAELADAPDLGSGGVTPVKVQVLSPAPLTPVHLKCARVLVVMGQYSLNRF